MKIQYLNAGKLLDKSYTDDIFKSYWSQVSKKAMLKDVKKRLVDHLKADGLDVTEDESDLDDKPALCESSEEAEIIASESEQD